MRSHRQLGNEHGSALTIALVVFVLASIVVVAIAGMLDWSGERSKSKSDRAQSTAIVDRALASYEYALESGLSSEYDSFRISDVAMTRLATQQEGVGGQAVRVANATLATFPTFQARGLHQTWMASDPGGRNSYAWTMRIDLGDNRSGWWQLVNVVPPNAKSGSLVAYVRTWISTSGNAPRIATEPRTVRAELRPGRFSDYQFLTDGPLVFGQSITVNGRVHTNGYTEAYLVDQATRPGFPLKLGYTGDPAPRCGRGAAFSVGKGRIEGTCTSIDGTTAPRSEDNGRLIDLLRGHAHLERMATMCGAAIFCPPGTGPWTVQLNGSRVTLTGSAGARSIDARTTNAAFIIGDVNSLSGQLTSGNFTLGVQGVNSSASAFGTGLVRLTGNGVVGGSTNARFGLVSDGDVVLGIDSGSCPRGFNGGIVSSSGALSIPAQYRVPSYPGGVLPTCASFSFLGSIGSHYMPLTRTSWSTGGSVGYASTSYTYDTSFINTPPPYFPTTGPWQTSTWKDAVPSCLTEAMRRESLCG